MNQEIKEIIWFIKNEPVANKLRGGRRNKI